MGYGHCDMADPSLSEFIRDARICASAKDVSMSSVLKTRALIGFLNRNRRCLSVVVQQQD
jgi:hypothetical protein